MRACWISDRHSAPTAVVVAGDELRADQALTIARRGHAVLWRGDYRNARQLLAAMRRRLDRRGFRAGHSPADTFHRHRQVTAHRASLLNRLVVELGPGYRLKPTHAPDVAAACEQACGLDVSDLPVAELGPGQRLELPYAPDVAAACGQACGPGTGLLPVAE